MQASLPLNSIKEETSQNIRESSFERESYSSEEVGVFAKVEQNPSEALMNLRKYSSPPKSLTTPNVQSPI